jgi:hypothetical protein
MWGTRCWRSTTARSVRSLSVSEHVVTHHSLSPPPISHSTDAQLSNSVVGFLEGLLDSTRLTSPSRPSHDAIIQVQTCRRGNTDSRSILRGACVPFLPLSPLKPMLQNKHLSDSEKTAEIQAELRAANHEVGDLRAQLFEGAGA